MSRVTKYEISESQGAFDLIEYYLKTRGYGLIDSFDWWLITKATDTGVPSK